MKLSVKLSAKRKPVTREQIRRKRESLEQAPVWVNGFLVDCDAESERRMNDVIDSWHDLQHTLVGNYVQWRMADNVIEGLSRSDLIDLLRGMRTARALRTDLLHAKQREFEDALLELTGEDITDDKWL